MTEPSAGRILLTAALIVFATSLWFRAVDPAVPQIAESFGMEVATAALISTAFALPYAITQPILGAIADSFGKTRLMTISIMLATLAAFAGAVALTFPWLAGTRALAGVVSGGIFPVAMALIGDRVPIAQRQVAMGRLLGGAMLGNLLGSPAAGLIGDIFGWRAIFVFLGAVGLLALIATVIGFRGLPVEPTRPLTLSSAVGNYRTILKSPLAKICYGAVFLEGVFVHGVFPYIANILAIGGEPRASIAGIVLAGFGLGGIFYSVMVGSLLRIFGERGLMIAGGLMMGVTVMGIALRMPWQFEFLNFTAMGLGFYMLHGVIQIYASELAPNARGSALSLHSTAFFSGMAVGPLVYGAGFATVGLTASVISFGFVPMLVGIVCARWLRRPAPAV